MKQAIVTRTDLGMGEGKLAAQVALRQGPADVAVREDRTPQHPTEL